MLKIKVQANKGFVDEATDFKEVTIHEVGLALVVLEKIKKQMLEIDFPTEYDITKESDNLDDNED